MEQEGVKCRQKEVDSSGIVYTSCAETLYLSLNYHRGGSSTTHPKSIWEISRPDECHVFCTAESESWADQNGDLWAVARDGEPHYGTRRERMAFFDAPVNQSDPWHGFPVGGRRGLPLRRTPPDAVVQRWWESKRISYTTYNRILTRRM